MSRFAGDEEHPRPGFPLLASVSAELCWQRAERHTYREGSRDRFQLESDRETTAEGLKTSGRTLFAQASVTEHRLGRRQVVDPFQLFSSERRSIVQLGDSALNLLLGQIESAYHVVPRDGTTINVGTPQQPMVLLQLVDRNDSSAVIFLYYLPQQGEFFLLQMQAGPDGQPQVRLWNHGASEILITPQGIALAPQSSRPSLGQIFTIHSWPHALECIAATLGITVNLSSLEGLMASAVCSAFDYPDIVRNIHSLVLTATNCLSIPGLGTNLVFATFGCLTGIAKLVSCGVANCSGGGGGLDDLQNDVPESGLSGASGSQQHFKISVPSGVASLVVTISGGSGDADLYVRRGQQATLSAYDCRPYTGGNSETCTFSGPQSGDWHIMLHGYSSFSGVTLRARYVTGPSCNYTLSPSARLQGPSADTGSVGVTTPGGCTWTAISSASWLNIISGNIGSGPGTVSYSVAANGGTSQRTGTLTIGGQTFTVTQDGGGGGGDLQNDVPVGGLSGASGSQQFFRILVPAGVSSLVVTISGGSGDADLYVRHGQQPTLSAYNCRPYTGGNSETCNFSNPQSGDWHIMLHGYTSFSGVTLRARR